MNIYQFALFAIPLLLLNFNLYRQLRSNWKEDCFAGFLGHLALATLVVEGIALIVATLFYVTPRLYQFYFYLGTLA